MIPMLRGSQYIHVPEDAFLPWLAHGWSLPMVVEPVGTSALERVGRPRPVASLGIIKKIVARHFEVTIEDLESARKARRVTGPRQVAYYLCAMLTLRSLPQIGRSFYRDHTTILHGIRKVRERIQRDEVFRESVEMLRERCEVKLFK